MQKMLAYTKQKPVSVICEYSNHGYKEIQSNLKHHLHLVCSLTGYNFKMG